MILARASSVKSLTVRNKLDLGAVAANVAKLMSHAVDHSHKHAIGNRVSALDSAPCIMLGLAGVLISVGWLVMRKLGRVEL